MKLGFSYEPMLIPGLTEMLYCRTARTISGNRLQIVKE